MIPAGSDMFPSPEIRVVEASAGSGKTYALARRYVQLILHLTRSPSLPPIHALLAITFTNKAAFEMKERILRFLKELALGCMSPEDQKQVLDPVGMTPAEARQAALRIMDVILRHYNHFQVQTIDKFINSLLVSCAFQIGLTADFRIKTSAREYWALALDSVIDEAGRDKSVTREFDDFLLSMLFVEARSAWLPKDVILDTLEVLYGESNTYGRDFLLPASGARPADILALKEKTLADVRAFVGRMPEGVHAVFARSLRKFVEEHESSFRFGQGLSSYFEPGKPIPFTKALCLTPWHVDQWARTQDDFVAAAEAEVRGLYGAYIRIFERVRRTFDALCRREDIVFLSELNARARRVYEQGLAPEELYYRLSTRFDHYLFDEFQDTSLLQWENLRVLPEDAVARGGSLFYVGDKKQAIYSFRGGETRLFDALKAQYDQPGYHLTCEHLNTSRRSHLSIVEFNNAVFDLANLQAFMAVKNRHGEALVPAGDPDAAELVRVYAGARQEAVLCQPPGCVRVESLTGTDKESAHALARTRVMARLKELRGRFDWRDIGILVRKNSEVEEVTRWLLEEQVPSSSERTLNIREHSLVAEVVSFFRFLVSPVDDAAFGAFIQGRVFAAASGVPQGDLQDAVLLWRKSRREPLYRAMQRQFPAAWELIDDFLKSAGAYPLYETVVSFYRRMGVLENFEEDQGFFMHWLDLVKEKEDEFPDAASFLACYDALQGDDLYVDVLGINAVQVMTVHKAKGLEFRAVIVPFLTMSLQAARSPVKRALEHILRCEEDGLALYHFNEYHAAYSPLAGVLSQQEKMSAFFDELNSIYVALTRAACEMYIFIPPKAGNGVNLAQYLIPGQVYSIGEPAGVYPQKKAAQAGSPCLLTPPACRDWMSFLKDEFAAMDDPASRAERRRGEAYHAALAGQTADLTDEMKKELDAFHNAPAIRPFFTAKDAEVFCEHEFVNVQGRTSRMDRVLVFAREVWVIDFKLTLNAREAGVDQLRAYKKILADVYSGRVIRGFLLTMKEHEVVEV